MTLDDLEVIRYDAYWAEYDKCPGIDLSNKHVRANRAAMRAVIEALRDEMLKRADARTAQPMLSAYAEAIVEDYFDEILASDLSVVATAKADGDEAAGGSTSNDEQAGLAATPTSAAAPDVCEWTIDRNPDGDGHYETQCSNSWTLLFEEPRLDGYSFCPSCGKPIKFKSEAAR